jgi:hypothetical protein
MRLMACIAALGVVVATTTAGGAEASYPGVWSRHALIVDLQNLPKRYDCDELWYKFRDVLKAIGARSDMKILPYRCDRGSAGYSPRVELTFSIPSEVTGKSARLAEMRIVPKSIRLDPGTLQSLNDQDCALLKQMKHTLLRDVGDTVSDSDLACQAPRHAASPPFGLTVKALLPLPPSPTHVAAAPLANRRGPARSGP